MMQPASKIDLGHLTVVGVGGGGSNIVARMAEEWAAGAGPACAVVNTDSGALDACPAPVKVEIGAALTRGLGAGGDPELGRRAAEDEFAALCGLFEGKELVFIVATLGGGTGTGAAPVLARAAHESGALVLALAALPFEFESEAVRRRAAQGLAALREEADAIVVIPNQRLFQAADLQAATEQAFAAANTLLARGIAGFWKMVVLHGVMSLTFADLRAAVRRGGGPLVFGYGRAEGAERARKAAEEAWHSPLLDGGRVPAEAEMLIVSLVFGPDVAFAEVEQAMETIAAAARKDANLHWGPAMDPSIPGRVEVTLIAAEPGPATTAAETAGAGSDGTEAAPAREPERLRQTQLGLEGVAKGRFKDVEPTLHGGENLDIPTYERRGVVIPK
jgi:cell division protein FtsZ